MTLKCGNMQYTRANILIGVTCTVGADFSQTRCDCSDTMYLCAHQGWGKATTAQSPTAGSTDHQRLCSCRRYHLLLPHEDMPSGMRKCTFQESARSSGDILKRVSRRVDKIAHQLAAHVLQVAKDESDERVCATFRKG